MSRIPNDHTIHKPKHAFNLVIQLRPINPKCKFVMLLLEFKFQWFFKKKEPNLTKATDSKIPATVRDSYSLNFLVWHLVKSIVWKDLTSF